MNTRVVVKKSKQSKANYLYLINYITLIGLLETNNAHKTHELHIQIEVCKIQ